MSAALEHYPVYRGPTFSLVDVRCRQRRSSPGDEEFSHTCLVAFPRRGDFVKHVGRTTLVADSSSAVFFNGGEAYRVSHPQDGGDECAVLSVREDLLREVLGASDPAARDRRDALFPFTHAPAHPMCLLRIAALRCHLSHPQRDPLAAEEIALQLLAAVVAAAHAVRGVRPPRRADTAAAHKRLADATQVLLATRFCEPLGLCDVARLVGASPFHLARLFRRQVGLSVHEYRTRLRLAAATRSLADGVRDLTRLALQVGFSSHSHFTTAFQQHLGVTPSAARGQLSRGRLRQMSTILKA